MKHPEYFNALIAPQKVHIFGSVAVKHIVCGLFIAMVALFFTSPTDEAGVARESAFDAPLPLPPELGLE